MKYSTGQYLTDETGELYKILDADGRYYIFIHARSNARFDTIDNVVEALLKPCTIAELGKLRLMNKIKQEDYESAMKQCQ